tara:strand:+ start:144 stop:320 length:177 start_codon:yes stop_codon:yes gene_type:complete
MLINDRDLLKFRLPLHINYIQAHIIKLNRNQTLEILNKYIDAEILEEKEEYYVLKKNN